MMANQQQDLFGSPPPAGFHKQTTGAPRQATMEAAASIRDEAVGLRQDVLDVLRAWGPHTADELADFLGKSVLAMRPRVAELSSEKWCQANLGKPALIYATGERRKNKSGRTAAEWGVVEVGYGNRP